MPDWLVSRPFIIALAILGGAFSLLASWCHSRGVLSESTIVRLRQAAYGFMMVSIILFIGAGLLGGAE